jgi:hypothetical protein
MTDKNSSGQNLLRTTARTILLIGSVGSLYFMFRIGSNQKSILLLGLFTIWVLSPFVGLLFAKRLSRHWTDKMSTWLYWTIIILTVASLTVYSGILTLSQTPPAFNFLFIPFLCWLVILTILLFANRQSRRDKKQT